MFSKSIFFSLFYGFSNLLIGQTKILPKFSVSASAGPATYWNKKITNVGFAHDYQYGQTNTLGFNTMFEMRALQILIGLNYQYLFFKYRGVGPYSQETPQVQTVYLYNGMQHAIEIPMSVAYPLRNKMSIGVSLTPRYLLHSTDFYLKEGVGILNSSDRETTYVNSEVWNTVQLLGGLVCSRSFSFNSDRQFAAQLSTNFSLTNTGGTDVYETPLSTTDSKSRFVSTQLGVSFYLK